MTSELVEAAALIRQPRPPAPLLRSHPPRRVRGRIVRRVQRRHRAVVVELQPRRQPRHRLRLRRREVAELVRVVGDVEQPRVRVVGVGGALRPGGHDGRDAGGRLAAGRDEVTGRARAADDQLEVADAAPVQASERGASRAAECQRLFFWATIA